MLAKHSRERNQEGSQIITSGLEKRGPSWREFWSSQHIDGKVWRHWERVHGNFRCPDIESRGCGYQEGTSSINRLKSNDQWSSGNRGQWCPRSEGALVCQNLLPETEIQSSFLVNRFHGSLRYKYKNYQILIQSENEWTSINIWKLSTVLFRKTELHYEV